MLSLICSSCNACWLQGATHLVKVVRKALAEETETFTMNSTRFIHGSGNAAAASEKTSVQGGVIEVKADAA